MSDPENFLTRWSRRKQDVAKEDAKEAGKELKPASEVSPAAAEQADAASLPAQPIEPGTVDLTKLPSLEDITAETDVTAFLRPGVPADLARAALRRAWTSDPAVRDFVGLQENDWAFNPPGAAEGFGPLGPEHDVGKLLARVFGEPAKEEKEESSTSNSTPSEQTVSAGTEQPSKPEAEKTRRDADEQVGVQRNNNPLPTPADDAPARRSHGGALPRPVSET